MKKCCQVIQSAALVTQNHLPKAEDLMLQNATPLRKSAPGRPPNSSDEHVSCTAPATENASLIIFADPLQMPHACHRFWKCHKTLTFDKVHNPLRRPRKSTSERPKVLRARQFFALLTWKCALRHNGVHFFESQLPKMLRTRPVFTLLTSKSASHHNCVQFFISHLARWLRTRRFSEPTFRPSGANPQCFATLLPFRASASSFFLLFLFSDLLSSALLFSDSSHLCFSICPYCRKFDF